MRRTDAHDHAQSQLPRDVLRDDSTTPQNLRKQGQVGGEPAADDDTETNDDHQVEVPRVSDNAEPSTEPKASTLEKQKVDEILDEEEAKRQEKN
jgi:hypothetical protein